MGAARCWRHFQIENVRQKKVLILENCERDFRLRAYDASVVVAADDDVMLMIGPPGLKPPIGGRIGGPPCGPLELGIELLLLPPLTPLLLLLPACGGAPWMPLAVGNVELLSPACGGAP